MQRSPRRVVASRELLARAAALRRSRVLFRGRAEQPYPERPRAYLSNEVDPRAVTSLELVRALDELGIGSEWVVAEQLRAYAKLHPKVADFGLPAGQRLSVPNRAFRNLIVGTIAEQLVLKSCLEPLRAEGFEIEDTRLKGDFTDYILTRGKERLPINVKVASTLYRNAADVGLSPTDCIPISTYKVIGACEKEPDLIYVDVVDYQLRYRVDAFAQMLTGAEALGWALLSWYGGRGSKKAQDEFVAALFKKHGGELMALTRNSDIRVVSGQRVRQIFNEMPERCPAFSSKGGGGPMMSDPPVHISVARETTSWSSVDRVLRQKGIAGLLSMIHRKRSVEVRRPEL